MADQLSLVRNWFWWYTWYILGTTENLDQVWSAYHVIDFNDSFGLCGKFWVILNILDQMGSVCLEVNFDGTFDLYRYSLESIEKF